MAIFQLINIFPRGDPSQRDALSSIRMKHALVSTPKSTTQRDTNLVRNVVDALI